MKEVSWTSQDKLEFFEYAGSIVWFLMDGFWMLAWNGLASLAVVPVLALNFAVFLYTPRTFIQMAVTVAMNAWLCMNISWMLADFRQSDILHFTARGFLGLGLLALVSAVINGLQDEKLLKSALIRFKRFRIKV